jgi:Protein of unknown function (DUF3047)
MNPRCWPRTATLLALAALLASCAGLSPPAPSADAGAWHDVPLPGKARTEYRWESSSGRRELPEGADLSEPGKTDAAARVMFAFDGDASRLSARTRAQSDLARMLTGEALPYATLVYVWDATAPVGTVITHPRNDRIRKIVVESGHGSLKQWRRYRRSLAADYQLAFGEPPGPLMAVAVMTDGDNTQSRLVTRYSDVEFR